MMIISLIGFLFIITYTSADSSGSSSNADYVTFSASPTEIFTGLTTDLRLQCSLTIERNSLMSSVMSIILSHSDITEQPVFNYLASVNAIEGHAHNLTQDFSEVHGSINNTGKSYISISIQNPNLHNAGIYRCEVNGIDQEGKPLDKVYLTTVHLTTINMSDMFDDVQKMKTDVEDMEIFSNMFVSRVNNMRETMFEYTTNYSGHRYYMTHLLHHFVGPEAQTVCEFYGGYLILIDSYAEHAFIRDWILKIDQRGLLVWTGVTNEDQGSWTNEPSLDGHTSSPTYSKDDLCRCFYRAAGWNQTNCICFHRDPSMVYDRYICEIP